MKIRMPWKRMRTKFTGDWADRLDSLFSCGVDYTGKSILDLGCNMGIVAYEICKHSPASIHGFDISREYVNVARSIFLAVPIESEFEAVDLGGRNFAGALKPSYDIVLALAVYHHVTRSAGVERAQAAMREAAKRCTSTIMIRDPGPTEAEIISLLEEYGFRPVWHSEKPAKTGRLTVLVRQ